MLLKELANRLNILNNRSDTKTVLANSLLKDSRKIRVNPLAFWPASQVAAYLACHSLLRHSFAEKGLPTIGCVSCSTRVNNHEDARAGHLRATKQKNCDIHLAAEDTWRAYVPQQ